MASTTTTFSLSLRTNQQTPFPKPSFFSNNNHLHFNSNNWAWASVSTARKSRICVTSSQVLDSLAAKSEPALPTTVEVDLGNRSYPIYIGSGLLNQPDYLQRFNNSISLTFVFSLFFHVIISNMSVCGFILTQFSIHSAICSVSLYCILALFG